MTHFIINQTSSQYMVLAVWIFVFPGYCLSCVLQQLGEGRTVCYSFIYKLWKLVPSLHKLESRDLQKYFCLTLSSVTHMHTGLSTILTHTSHIVFQWSIQPHLQHNKLAPSLFKKVLFLCLLRCGLRSSVQSPGMTRTTKNSPQLIYKVFIKKIQVLTKKLKCKY